MPELLQDGRLTEETVDQLLVELILVLQLLDDHPRSVERVPGDIDHRHAAFADLRDDGVVVNPFAWSHIVRSSELRVSAPAVGRPVYCASSKLWVTSAVSGRSCSVAGGRFFLRRERVF